MLQKINNEYLDLNSLELSPLQAEKDEWILTPDGGLVKSAAKKKHSQMDDDEVTDVLPENSYIFSNDPNMKVKKKDFEGLPVFNHLVNYQEGVTPEKPEQTTFDEFFSSANSLTPAQIAEKIQNKYPVFTQPELNYNPFVKRANAFNKESRIKPLTVLQTLNEIKKSEVEGVPQQGVPQFQMGGRVPKYQFGDFLGGAGSGAAAGSVFGPVGSVIGGVLGGIGSIFAGKSADKEAERRRKELQLMLDQQKELNNQGFQAANLTTLGKAALPTPIRKTVDFSDTLSSINNTYDPIFASENSRKQAAFDITQSPANTLVRNASALGLNPTQTQNMVSNATGQAITSGNQANQSFDQYFDRMRLGRGQDIKNIMEKKAFDTRDTEYLNDSNRYNKGMQVVNEFGSNFQNKLSNDKGLLADSYGLKNQLEFANSAERANTIGRFQNSLTSAGTGIGAGLQAFENRKLTRAFTDSIAGGGAAVGASDGASDGAGLADPAAYQAATNYQAGQNFAQNLGNFSVSTPGNTVNNNSPYIDPMSAHSNSIFTDPASGRSYIVNPITGELIFI